MYSRFLITSALCYFTGIIAAQSGSAPVIYNGGTVNAANLFPTGAPNYGAAPGSIVSIFGTNLAVSVAQASGIPLLTTLNGTSVTIGGVAAPLFYVSPEQINAQVPYDAPTGNQPVIVTTAAGTGNSGVVALPIKATLPAVFSWSQNGRGQAAAQNAIVNGTNVTYTYNSASAAVAQGNLLVVYGTGGGGLANGPVSGAACTGQQFSGSYSATIGGVAAGIQYAGCSPGYVGLDQWNITIPSSLPDGCFLPLQVTVGGVASNVVTVAVSKTGDCSSATTGLPAFPVGQSYGMLLMGRVVAVVPSGTVTTSEFVGSFNQLAASSTPSAGGYPPVGGGCLTEVYKNLGSGSPALQNFGIGTSSYSNTTALDAGTLVITSPSGVSTTVTPASTGNYQIGPSFGANGLTIAAGNWTVKGSGGKNVGAFTANATVSSFIGSPAIGVTGGRFSASSPLTMTWTCPDPTAQMMVSVDSSNLINGVFGGTVCSAACSAGTLSIPSSALKQLPLSSGGSGANIYLFLYPSVANAAMLTAPGLNVGYWFLFDAVEVTNLALTP